VGPHKLLNIAIVEPARPTRQLRRLHGEEPHDLRRLRRREHARHRAVAQIRKPVDRAHEHRRVAHIVGDPRVVKHQSAHVAQAVALPRQLHEERRRRVDGVQAREHAHGELVGRKVVVRVEEEEVQDGGVGDEEGCDGGHFGALDAADVQGLQGWEGDGADVGRSAAYE
jgi:hypothetical protein